MTDTSVGSSGSPVFNDQWQVIALHSAGVPKKNANGDYLDKDDHIIVPQKGKIDGSRVVWLSNRRIRISSIMANLKTNQAIANHPLILQLAAMMNSTNTVVLTVVIGAEGRTQNGARMMILILLK